MKWMLHVFFATTVFCAGENISDSKIYCDAGDAIAGQSALITCYFHQDLQAGGRTFSVAHYRSSAFEDTGTDIVLCKWSQGSKDVCVPNQGYGYELSNKDTLTLTIANVTRAMAGIYDCNLVEDTSPRLPCTLTVIETQVEKYAEPATDASKNLGLIIGISAGVGAVIVLTTVIICLCRRRRRRRKTSRAAEISHTVALSATSKPSDQISPKTDTKVNSLTVMECADEVQISADNSSTPLLSNPATSVNHSAEMPEESKTTHERDRYGPSDAPGEVNQCGDKKGKLFGNQPLDGKMTMTYSKDPLPGYGDTGSFEIRYIFPSGKQSASHPHPGKPYEKTNRVAYLPDTPEGRMVLMLLKVAFDRQLTFTIGVSKTEGSKYEGIVWNGIPHKTDRTGGKKSYTYPDENYMGYVQSVLRKKKVTKRDLTDVQRSFVRTPEKTIVYNDPPSDFSHIFSIEA